MAVLVLVSGVLVLGSFQVGQQARLQLYGSGICRSFKSLGQIVIFVVHNIYPHPTPTDRLEMPDLSRYNPQAKSTMYNRKLES